MVLDGRINWTSAQDQHGPVGDRLAMSHLGPMLDEITLNTVRSMLEPIES